ncbi:hypothetical protein COCOBI_03-7120 [Coccomyxa sp. Obi]|nr:hypothetical protein COCOBI_03-7120 [Coccomyxa sp. Obi]
MSIPVILKHIEDNSRPELPFRSGTKGSQLHETAKREGWGEGVIREEKHPHFVVTGDCDEPVYDGLYLFRRAHSGPGSVLELDFPDYLQQKFQVSTLDEYLLKYYKAAYDKARPGKPRYRGRLPSDLRSRDQPFRRSVEDINGREYPLDLGRQLPLICRQDMIRAALYFYAKIENRFMYGGGSDLGYTRSLCLMALVGSPGTGKTTALLELVHLMREHIETQREDALTLLSESVPLRQDGAQTAEDSLQRLSRSVCEGKELVSWLRLDVYDKLVPGKEDNVGIDKVLALRLFYGFLSYLDNLEAPTSPVGSYQDFLDSLDDRVRQAITPAHAFTFLDSVTHMDPKAQRVVFVLLDEFNAVQDSFPRSQIVAGRPQRTWAQDLASALVRFTGAQEGRERLMLPIIATSRHTDATLASTSTPKAKVAPLPLNAPLLPDIQAFLRGIAQRVQRSTGSTRAPSKAADDELSPVVQLAAWVGGNFRLMAWLLELLGGADPQNVDAWKPENLADWLSSDRTDQDRLRGRIHSILQGLHGLMQQASWFNKLVGLPNGPKMQIMQQAVAHAVTGAPVILGDKVLPDFEHRWGDLLNEGLIHPVFLIEERIIPRAHVRLGESPLRAPAVQVVRAAASASKAYHNLGLHGSLPPSSDLGSARSPGVAAPATPLTRATRLTAVEPVASSASPTRSPDLQLKTALGMRRVTEPRDDLSSIKVTIELAPAVMSGMWVGIEMPNLSPLAEVAYQEDAEKKELVDLAAVLFSMFLRRKFLGQDHCRLPEVVRAIWLPPWAATLLLELPDPSVSKSIARFKGHLTTEHYKAVRTAAHVALDYNAARESSFEGVEEAARMALLNGPGVAVSASSNFGADSFLFARTRKKQTSMFETVELEDLDIIFQSKRTEGDETQTLRYALAQEKKDVEPHGITCGKAPPVEGLWGPEDYHPSKSARLQAETAESRGMQESSGGFPGGNMEEFQKAVMKKSSTKFLDTWEEQLLDRGVPPPETSTPFLYLFVTDHRMTLDQHTRLRVLSLAGHPLASRMVFIDRAQHKTFYGMATAIQRNLAKLQELGQ